MILGTEIQKFFKLEYIVYAKYEQQQIVDAAAFYAGACLVNNVNFNFWTTEYEILDYILKLDVFETRHVTINTIQLQL